MAAPTKPPQHSPADSYDALPVQQGLLFHGLLAPGSGVDVLQYVIDMGGPVDGPALESAWQRASDRHATLRTAFEWPDAGPPVQVVRPAVTVPIRWHDGIDLDAFLRADRVRGLDPAQAPMLRVTVLRPATVVVTMHHAVVDGRAVQMLLHEVFADYRAGAEGRTATFPERPPFRDFAVWWAGRDQSAAERFWTGALRDWTGPTPLGIRETGGGAEVGSRTIETVLPAGTTDRLRALAIRAGCTENTVVCAAWALLLSRFSGHRDVTFGIVRSCRRGTVDGADEMIGLLANTLPLRLGVDPERPLLDWLAEVRRATVAVAEHRLTPLTAIRDWCHVPYGVPVFDSVVAYEREALAAGLCRLDPAWHGRSIRILRHPSPPVTLYLYGEERLRIQLIVHYDRFDEQTSRDLLRRYTDLLAAMGSAGPHARVDDLPLLDPGERATLLNRWSGADRAAGGAPDAAWPETVPARFAVQATATPDATAVVTAGTTLSYAELDARANRLANLLVACGVTADTPVGVALHRSAELVVALLAVLKAGGAYVPLDPANPARRNALILADCGAPVVLTTGDLAATVPATGTALVLDRIADLVAGQPDTAPVCPARPDSLAYVSYTSGSTGAPKGVAIPHRAVLRLVREPTFATFGPGETLLQLAPVSFDASTVELWGSLLTGARLAVAPPGPLSLGELAAVLRRYEVSTLWLTAGLFHQLVECDVDALRGVRQLLAGGDVLAPDAVRAALAARGGQPVVNGYGPTENTTFTCCHRMTGADAIGERVPIGRPIQRTTAYVLDARLRPVPAGVEGELHIGGAGLARGYLGRPDLTADRFVPDPFAGPPGTRMYRSGDRVRWRVDGVLEFLGRLDHQVKIRGFRTEPGEAEAVLREHPQVGDAVVVVRGDGDDRRLVAYLVPKDSQPDQADLRRYAASRLPDHLCPASYVLLGQLPLTVNGKVDRAALPAPVPAASGGDGTLSTPTQRRLAGLWTALLGSRPTGPDDDFFAQGGDSLKATRLAFRINQVFGVDLPIRRLIESSTLGECAAAIDQATATAGIRPGAWRKAAPVPGHLAPLTDDWAIWRWVGLRSPGFPIRPVLDLAHPRCAAAADALLVARSRADWARHELAYQLRQALGRGVDGTDPAALKRAVRQLRRGPVTGLDPQVVTAVPPSVATEARSAARTLEAAETAYRESIVDAGRARSRRLGTAAGDPRFREAVAWQNRHALRTGVDAIARAAPSTPPDSQHRQHEALVANYLQRYCVKNDTIGFFGPVGWGRIVDGAAPLTVTPGPGLLADRTVYLEDWCVHALALRLAADRRLRPWLVPRRMPYLDVVDGWLQVPLAEPVRLSPLEAAVLPACDGIRTAEEVAAEVGGPAADVYAVLGDLASAGRIAWTLEAPSDRLFPERALRRRLDLVADDDVRAPALRALTELEAARDAVAAAAGDAADLVDALESLEATFTGLTGAAPTRRDGQLGAGRTLVYEDCRRDVEVTIGTAALAGLGPPLALLLDSARWFTFAGAALFQRACADIYRDRCRQRGTAELPFAEFWLWINDLFADESGPLITPVTRAFQERWAKVLAVPPGQRRVRYAASALRAQVAAVFAAPRPGWGGAVRHSPDVMIAASSLEDIEAGRFEWVLGELHPGTDTLSSGVFFTQHPDQDDLRRAVVADVPPRVLLASSRGDQGPPIRIRKLVSGPDDLRLVFGRDTCLRDPRQALPVGHCVLEEVGGRLVVRTRDGRHTFTLIDVLGELLMQHLLQQFRILPAAGHTPRITVDRMVLSRECWTFDPAGLTFAGDRDEAQRFLAVRQWRLAHGMPRFVFAHTSAERKPFFVDFDSLASADLLARSVRRAARSDARSGVPSGARSGVSPRVTVAEMLPEPGQLWLTDIDGNRYTSELRLVAVDRRHAHPAESG